MLGSSLFCCTPPSGFRVVVVVSVDVAGALADCGLRHTDVDGLFVNAGGDFDKMAELLGLSIGHANQFWTHGRMCAPVIQQAALNVIAGFADVIACVYAIDITERGGGFGGGRRCRVRGRCLQAGRRRNAGANHWACLRRHPSDNVPGRRRNHTKKHTHEHNHSSLHTHSFMDNYTQQSQCSK